MAPFGFISDGFNDETTFVDNSGDRWYSDEYGDRSYMGLYVMSFNDDIELEHLLFLERKCRVCGKVKNLLNDFYKTRKDRTLASSYSYECKECTKRRVNRKKSESKRILYGNIQIGDIMHSFPVKIPPFHKYF